MTFELWTVIGAVILLFLLLNYQGYLVPKTHSLKWGLGSRDEPKPLSVLQGRAARTIANHMESMALFVPLILIAHLIGVSTTLTHWGAGLYLGGRVLFAIFYMGGISVLRSAAWGVSIFGIILVFSALI